MCDVRVFETGPNSGDLDTVCLTSGKQITETGKYGMFCEDFCDLDKAKELMDNLDSFLSSFLGDMGVIA